ncbi:unnamed protein product [Effrenium voratum]|uniref:J domain-containing protein n=1 Tax=Effrenium voratum TaxID=2562239 RepID=A0AA36N5N3_9DINO|nr:unnamed protein product [Effrenium voratum]
MAAFHRDDEVTSPTSERPRMLRIEEELGDMVKAPGFNVTLRENIARYFGVPARKTTVSQQAVYDEDGLLATAADLSQKLSFCPDLLGLDLDVPFSFAVALLRTDGRALQRYAPKLYVLAPRFQEFPIGCRRQLDPPQPNDLMAAPEPDYYQLLGVQKGATLQEIRAEFRKKVLAEHPDKGGDPKKFQLLNKAYNVLSDQDKRRRYDDTGRTERSVEEEFAESFGGGRLSKDARPKEADERAVVNMEERISKPGGEHEEGFQEWLRQRDQQEMVMTDKDFMKTALFNAAEMTRQVRHAGLVQHVLGSPKTDAYGQTLGGAVQVQSKPKSVKKTIDHDELLVRMLAVPVDDSMVYAELNKSGVCLGMTGVGRVEQLGARCAEFKEEDTVLILPKPTKFSSQKPIGSARTLLHCSEEDLIRVPPDVLEQLNPDQICLAPTIVCAYLLLEIFGAKLKPGDSVLLNAAHLSAAGSSLLQLCRLLKLKPLCLLPLPGAPKNLVKGEYGSKSAWQDASSQAQVPKNVQTQYERISEWLLTMGAEEVFPDAVALLRWRDRNQRMLPKLALDGIATRDSAEQLIHCLQPGDKDAQMVVYGHGVMQPIEIAPPLLAAWGGSLIGFNIARWVHALSANAKKMMAVMENITKLICANKFTLDTVLYKVGEDAISDAFARAADASDSAQVVLIFPTLQDELQSNPEPMEDIPRSVKGGNDAAKKKEEDEREKLKEDWLKLLFTDGSVAATQPEGPLPTTLELGEQRRPESLVVWVGDNPKSEHVALKDVSNVLGRSGLVSLSWSQHPAGEGMLEFEVGSTEVTDGSWYMRSRTSFENEDLDMLHDVEVLGRSLAEALEPKLKQSGLGWKNVILCGFGKGAGVALYAALMKIIPQPVSAMIFFSPIVAFPGYLAERLGQMTRNTTPVKMFIVWGNRNKSTPGSYRQLLAQALRKAPEVHLTPDTLPDGDHVFDVKSFGVLGSLLPLCLPR